MGAISAQATKSRVASRCEAKLEGPAIGEIICGSLEKIHSALAYAANTLTTNVMIILRKRLLVNSPPTNRGIPISGAPSKLKANRPYP